MKREIKFRSFTSWNKKMRYDISNIHFANNIEFKGNPVMVEFDEAGNKHGMATGIELMQYTGLKDKNGKEIYEGDIIEYTTCGIQCKAFIVWNSYCGAWQYEYLGAGSYNVTDFLHTLQRNTRFPANEFVIGNIYENPELLK